MAGIIDLIADKLNLRGKGGGGGDKSQLILAAGLVLVIIISVSVVFSNMGKGSNGPSTPQVMKMQDLETGEVFDIDPAKMGPDVFLGGMPGERIPNPNTGKRTCVMMMKCPACNEYFVPAYAKSNNPEAMMNPGPLICEKCGVDINQWYRDHRKKRK